MSTIAGADSPNNLLSNSPFFLTEFEVNQLNVCCKKLGLDLDPGFQQTKEGLFKIYQEMIAKLPKRKDLLEHFHDYEISLFNFKSICSKIVYGHFSHIRSDPFAEFRDKLNKQKVS